jgi:hypothetical protein
MKSNQQEASKEYAFYLLKQIADALSCGMEKIKSEWQFTWDGKRKDLKAINKSNGSSLEIHLNNISGLKDNTPDFNMCIFPIRLPVGRVNINKLKLMPPHRAAHWESNKVSDSISNGIVGRGGVGTSDNKPLEASSFRGMKRNRFSKTNVPISKC